MRDGACTWQHVHVLALDNGEGAGGAILIARGQQGGVILLGGGSGGEVGGLGV